MFASIYTFAAHFLHRLSSVANENAAQQLKQGPFIGAGERLEISIRAVQNFRIVF